MANRISAMLNIDPKLLSKEGAFDGFVDIDSKFYIDPRLLDISTQPEFEDSRKTFENYFKNIFTLLKHSKNENDRFWREAYKQLHFKEIDLIGLGYSVSSTSGNAIGNIHARTLINTSKELIDAGITDPTIFELLGLFEEGIGADRISDATALIISEHLIKYSARITRNLNIKNMVKLKFSNSEYSIPRNAITKKPIIFVPKDILSPLPVAYSWDDIDTVCMQNEVLRKRVNEIIGDTWKKATNQNKIRKSVLRKVLFSEPDLLKDLLKSYKKKPKHKYDFRNDPTGEIIWADIAEKFSAKYPLDLKTYSKLNANNILDLVKSICEHFAELLEANGLCELLWYQNKLRNERFAQKLFYGIADSYCKANDLDLSREPNAGRGPVDFKISSGYNARVLVEVKYSTNPNLTKGYLKQLPTYNRTEKTLHSIYLIIRTSTSELKIKALNKIKSENEKKNLRSPEIIVADGRIKKSASKL